LRLNDALITSEKYRGEPTTDAEGRTQWPVHILWDDEIQGFGVRIFPPVRGRPSRKDFLVTWKIGLRTRTMSIGTFGVDCTLRQARKMAREAIDLSRRGQDPIEARNRALGIGTSEDLASRFLVEHNASRKKPGIPGGEVATAPEPEPDGGSVAAVSLPNSSIEPPASESASPEITEPAEDPVSVAAATEAEAQGALDDEAESEPESEPAFTPAPSAPAPATPQAPAAPLHAKTPAAHRRPLHETGPRATEAPTAPAAPAAPAAPVVAEPARRTLVPPPPPVKRGPTKVRLLPVPEALYKVIEHGARESEMTIAAYLNALIEIARAAVGDAPAGPRNAGGDAAPPDETGPSIRELFAQVQEAQAVEVGGSDHGGLEGEPV
jgi:hypothetical protein